MLPASVNIVEDISSSTDLVLSVHHRHEAARRYTLKPPSTYCITSLNQPGASRPDGITSMIDQEHRAGATRIQLLAT
jgi:hypothetical protein